MGRDKCYGNPRPVSSGVSLDLKFEILRLRNSTKTRKWVSITILPGVVSRSSC